jgi:succinate-semialdehyde dehydrogenase / glutarate-semialdehyde dehydrogenase
LGYKKTKPTIMKTFPITNPATGGHIADVADQTLADLDSAVARATEAQSAWARRTAYDREKVIRTATNYVRTQAEQIGLLMAQEQGKPLKQSVSEVIGGCDMLDYYAAEGLRIEGYSNPTEAGNLRSWVSYVPVGVCGLITPWNYPVALLSWKLGPMLAAGCAGVVKPTPVTPLSPSAFCHALVQGGIPAGVIEVITGSGPELGAALVAHTGVKKIAMTGSTATGKAILTACAPHLKKVSLELGGNCPAIVCADADIAHAAKIIAYKGFRNMGQSCSTVNRCYVHASIAEEFTKLLILEAEKLTLGDPVAEPGCDLGPFATESARAKVEEHIGDALAKGASLHTGGRRPVDRRIGYYFLPAVLTGLTPQMRMSQEETFGPVVPIATFETNAEALSLANATEYGLCAYLFARDFATITTLSESLNAGTVCVNNGAVNTSYAPYEGWGDSGFGMELGRRAIYEYLKTKHIKVFLPLP